MTNSELLDGIVGDDYAASIRPASNAAVLRANIRKSPEFRELQGRYESGAITDGAITQLVQLVTQQYFQGESNATEVLSTVAVLLEMVNTEFAGEYLNDLSRAKAQGLGLARALAQHCLSNRRREVASIAWRFVRPILGPEDIFGSYANAPAHVIKFKTELQRIGATYAPA